MPRPFGIAALLSLVFPLSLLAQTGAAGFENLVPPRTLGVELTVNNERRTLFIAPNTAVTIRWKSSGAGCVGNWRKGVLPATDQTGQTGVVAASRTFSLACFGDGAAEMKRVSVQAVKPDLSVPRFQIEGLERIGNKRNTYRERMLTLSAPIRNGGKLRIGTLTTHSFQWSRDRANWAMIETKALAEIGAGEVKPLPAASFAARADGTTYFFRVCADSGNAIDETSEKNNCSRVLGPYIFAAQ